MDPIAMLGMEIHDLEYAAWRREVIHDDPGSAEQIRARAAVLRDRLAFMQDAAQVDWDGEGMAPASEVR